MPISERILFQLTIKPTQANIIHVYGPTIDKKGQSKGLVPRPLISPEELKQRGHQNIYGWFQCKIWKFKRWWVCWAVRIWFVTWNRQNTEYVWSRRINGGTLHLSAHLWSWKSSADRPDHIKRYDIGLILVNKRYFNIFYHDKYLFQHWCLVSSC